MGMSAERSPHGRGARAGQADVTKKKTDFRKAMPEIWRLVRPRKWLLLLGLLLGALLLLLLLLSTLLGLLL